MTGTAERGATPGASDSSPGPPATGTWAAMSSPGFRQLFYSASIVIFGVMAQQVARGWLARDLTGSNAGLGGAMLVFGISMLLTTPWGGVAADRLPKRSVLFAATATMMASSLLVGLAVATDTIAYWMLLVASAVQAASFAFYLPARIAYITEVVDSSLIGNAIVLSQTAQEAVRVVAPALAGVMIGVAWLGISSVFFLAGAASALSLWFVATLPDSPPRQVAPSSPIGELVDAVRYMRSTTGLGLVALTTIGVVIVGFPYLVFLPTLADERYDVGAFGYGAMSGVAGLGAVVAGVRNARPRAGRRPWRTIAGAGTVFGGATIALGLAGTFPLALVALAVIGGSALVFQTSTQSLMLQLSDIEYHGRLQSMVVLGFSGFGLAALPLGLLADAISLRTTLILMGTGILVIIGVFSGSRLRQSRTPLALEIG